MKTYLVGGAVRDKLLGRTVTEKDWVVVGSNPEQMIASGFTPVGQDFPVFLHPQTKEEYALARTERKTGKGYGGFSFYCGEEVTLEDDLIRRDLTINAMAEDDDGNIIDPYNGQQDLADKLLRHVSPAFAEDPVRILRIARFAARYHALGFRVANETITLMQTMVANGEVDHLVAERVWKETERALGEPHPEIFIEVLRACNALARLFPEIDALFGVPQTAIHHPEIDTGIHTLMSLQQAVQLSPGSCVRFATLLHDLGKATTPPDEWPRHIAHEDRSLPLIKKLCERIAAPKDYKDLALMVAQWHTHCHRALELKPVTVLKVLQSNDAFRRPERFEQFLLCCEADARGRTGFEDRAYPQADFFRTALKSAQTVDIAAIQQGGFSGKEFGDEVNRQRLQNLMQLKKQSSNPTPSVIISSHINNAEVYMQTSTSKVALVTGAAKRIGAEIARQLHKEHFNVVIHYHQSEQAAKELADELNEERENSAFCIAADLNNLEQISSLATQAQQQWQRIDLLVNNASSFYPTPIGETSEEDWNHLINSNLKAPFFLAQALAEHLGAQRGCIINIADIYADKPLRKHSIYSIAKAGNVMLTKTLAQELAPQVRVNGIAPGAILWPDDSHKKPEDRLSDDNKERMLAKIPLQQRGQAQDIARTILFLTQSPYITGQILTVDGGRSITI